MKKLYLFLAVSLVLCGQGIDYARIRNGPGVSVAAFGALGNGTSNDTNAIKAAIASAVTSHSFVFFPPGTYKTTSVITLSNGIKLIGAGYGTYYPSASTCAVNITNATSDIFNLTASTSGVVLQDLCLTSTVGGGHILNLSGGHFDFGVIERVYFTQYNNAKSIVLSTTASHEFIGNVFRNNIYQASGANSVAIIDVENNANNDNIYADSTISVGLASAAYAIISGGTGGGINATNNKFDNIIFEQAQAGALKLYQSSQNTLDSILIADTIAPSKPLITLSGASYSIRALNSNWGSATNPDLFITQCTLCLNTLLDSSITYLGSDGTTPGAYITVLNSSVLHRININQLKLDSLNFGLSFIQTAGVADTDTRFDIYGQLAGAGALKFYNNSTYIGGWGIGGTNYWCLNNSTFCTSGVVIDPVNNILRNSLFTPASSAATCTAGQIADDANYHYVCTAANTWKRAALSAF